MVAAIASGLGGGLWALLPLTTSGARMHARPAAPVSSPAAPAAAAVPLKTEAPIDRSAAATPAALPGAAPAAAPAAPQPTTLPPADRAAALISVAVSITQPPDDVVDISCTTGVRKRCQRQCTLRLGRPALLSGAGSCTITAEGFTAYPISFSQLQDQVKQSGSARLEVVMTPVRLDTE